MLLAHRIRKIRESYNLTQSDVAFKCGISSSAYGQIERRAGKCSFDTLSKVANAIGVTTPFLIDIGNERFIESKE
jgi:transcriptional regulator with XRE-family HTH domain